MDRNAAIAAVRKYFDNGSFHADLGRRVAIPTESQNPERAAELARYLDEEMVESLARLGMQSRTFENPAGRGGPFLVAELIEDPKRPTVLLYGHGDVIRGQDTEWRAGLNPWQVKQEGDRIYGRGTADNKGQHTINLAAIEAVLRTRGKLGFNLKVLIETGEET
ncbi:MAG TPA: M20/M25/M40 family metallo-hydrolase, partial [Burkholderiales bacterium]|nr:M20/M25/M40 family metallo-hydrolase [Burkholderiales bacterium]